MCSSNSYARVALSRRSDDPRCAHRLGKAVSAACDELDTLGELEREQLEKAEGLLKQFGFKGSLFAGDIELCRRRCCAVWRARLACKPQQVPSLPPVSEDNDEDGKA